MRSALERTTAEGDLFTIITGRLAVLCRSFPSHRSLFTPGDIEFLQSLGGISDHLRAFIELEGELLGVDSLTEYENIVRRLVQAKNALASFPVARQVAKEIRALNERLPAIREQDEAQRKSRLEARILDWEQNPRRCLHNHAMVIRQGTHGYFWGCSRYPFCRATAQLTRAENGLLTSQSGKKSELPGRKDNTRRKKSKQLRFPEIAGARL
ncbi:MAG TPA: hypothetical protein VG672_06180 [Bryobacteraceae bacterium]|nr:hypothetical protein [Bryobacteraceae bacterium]